MEFLIIIAAVVLVLAVLSIASVVWGVDGRNPFTNGNSYDPRYDWQTRH